MTDMAVSPDCRSGNCRKCNGWAWDEKQDRETPCRCEHHGERSECPMVPGLIHARTFAGHALCPDIVRAEVAYRRRSAT